MAKPRSIYDQLTGVKIDDATITQLDFTKNTFIDEKSIGWWKGPITISKVLEASRTYAHGLPIPNESGVATLVLADSASGFFQPPGSEIWVVQALKSDQTVSISLTDGASFVITHSGTAIEPTAPLYLTNSLYYAVANGSGAEATILLAYHKLSL